MPGSVGVAIEAANRQGAVEVLEKVLMSESSTTATVDAVLAEPNDVQIPAPNLKLGNLPRGADLLAGSGGQRKAHKGST